VNGEAEDPDFRFEPRVSIQSFFPEPGNAFDRKAASDAKVEQLLMTASLAFNRSGVDGTSLDAITAALGATKGVFYHYLKNKTDLVVRCYRRSFDLTERFADACEQSGGSGLERATLGLYLNVQAHASGLSPLILMAGASALPAAAKRETTRRARKLQSRFRVFGEEGLADGSFRAIDFDAVAQLGAGAFEWLPKWFSTEDPRAPEILAREIVDLFTRGLRAR
jgi:AcrR family transcriptional regulator